MTTPNEELQARLLAQANCESPPVDDLLREAAAALARQNDGSDRRDPPEEGREAVYQIRPKGQTGWLDVSPLVYSTNKGSQRHDMRILYIHPTPPSSGEGDALRGSSECPICANSSPHQHTGVEVAEYRVATTNALVRIQQLPDVYADFRAWADQHMPHNPRGWETWLAAHDRYSDTPTPQSGEAHRLGVSKDQWRERELQIDAITAIANDVWDRKLDLPEAKERVSAILGLPASVVGQLPMKSVPQPAPASPQGVSDALVDAALRAFYGADRAWLLSTHADMRRALEAVWPTAAGAAPEGWLPIETAPKDGTAVLLGSVGGTWIAKYVPEYQSGFRPADPWFCMMLNRDHIPREVRYAKPTHWQPLPATPNP